MTKSETFILNIRGYIDPAGIGADPYFYIHINIPELRRYKKHRIFIKDFVIVNGGAPDANLNTGIYTLNSDTLTLNNNYDNFLSNNILLNQGSVLQSSSKVLAIVATKEPYSTNQQEQYYDCLNINGNHRFFISNFLNSVRPIGSVNIIDIDFYFSIVVKASDE